MVQSSSARYIPALRFAWLTRITIALMKAAVLFLVRHLRYEVPEPEQDLSLEMSRMPALPRSRFVMTRVRRAA